MRSLIATLVLGIAPTALAADLEVPSPTFPTIQSAVTAASAQDTIILAAGTYDEAITVTVPLTFRAAPDDIGAVFLTHTEGTADQIIEGNGTSGSLTFIDIGFVNDGMDDDLRAVKTTGFVGVTMTNVSASGFTTSGDGALLDVTDSLQISLNQVVADNLSALRGGAVSVNRSNPALPSVLTVRGSSFTDCSAVEGGAIALRDANLSLAVPTAGAINAPETVFAGNEADFGGAIWSSVNVDGTGLARSLTLQEATFDDNTATELGGAIYASGVTLTSNPPLNRAVSFMNNSAGSGGGIWAEDRGLERLFNLSGATSFVDNVANGLGSEVAAMDGHGGAAFLSAQTVRLTNVAVEGSESAAGGVWIEATTSTLLNTTFTDNEAEIGGAGVHVQASGVTNVTNSDFTMNTTDGDGAALWLLGPELQVTGGLWSDNEAMGDGAALWAQDAILDIDGATFNDNVAANGAAIHREGAEADATLTDNRFVRNTAGIGGAAFVHDLTTLTLTRNLYCDNASTTGGVHVEATGIVTISNDGAAGNLAANGSVYHVTGATRADIQFSTFADNNGTGGSVFAGFDLAEPSNLTSIAATDNQGTAFIGTNSPVPLVDASAFDGNGNDFGGTWNSAAPTAPVDISGALFLYNAPYTGDCDTLALYPHPSSPLIDLTTPGPDIDNTGADAGLSGGPMADPQLFVDGDSDGFDRLYDCDDDNRDSNPMAPDICNDLDDDCDGDTDEDPELQFFEDVDGDGFGDPEAPIMGEAQCDPPAVGAVSNSDDCDDSDSDINPDADEICDGVDNNCDTIEDTDAVDRIPYYRDVDFDGFGVETTSVLSCEPLTGFVIEAGDCDDTRANVNPDAQERCDTIDNDCDGEIDTDGVDAPRWYPDMDQDGFGDGVAVIACLPPDNHSPFNGDCDDDDANRAPDNDEICDGIDNDCDDEIDVDPVMPLYFPDNDGDGFGDGSAIPIGSCEVIPSLLEDGSDCDDGDPTIKPGAVENCDGKDQDCDGDVDNDPIDGTTFFLDVDGDDFGDGSFPIVACSQPGIAAAVDGDCDDGNEVVFPGNTEVCDFFDNNCDGEIDEDSAADAVLWFADADDDGYGSDENTTRACEAPIRHVSLSGDCDDNNPQSFPGLLEVCDGVDNDCDGLVDGPTAQGTTVFYEDADGDGFGNPRVELRSCTIPDGYVSNDNDCDDTAMDIFPGALEIAGNAIDEDCDGQALAGAATQTPPDEDPGCGCSSTSSPSQLVGFLPLALGLLLRRRR